MNTDYILRSDLLDIIFDKRNKGYGAYTLRKFYNERLYKSLAIMVSFAVLMSAFTLLPKKTSKDKFIIETTPGLVAVDVPKEKPLEPKKPEQPKVPEKPKELQPPAKTTDYTVPIVTTNKVTTKISNITDSTQIGTVLNLKPSNATPVTVQPVVPTAGSEGGGGGGTAPAINRDLPMLTAEVMPQYPGGLPALRKFLERNLENPQDLDEGQTISVKVKFIVGYDGTLKGFETIEDGGKAFNNEVIRVLKKMPSWIPGKSQGQNVSVFYVVPVKFTPAG